MRNHRSFRAAFLAVGPFGVWASVLAAEVPGERFVHIARPESISGSATYLEHPLLNGDPTALPLVTQNWNPGRRPGIYNNDEVGVYYAIAQQRWVVYREGEGTMTENAAFNVFVPAADGSAVLHTTTDPNSTGNSSQVEHASANGNQSARVFVTHAYSSSGAGEYHDHPIGVWYNGANRWAVFNEDGADMGFGRDFNVFVAPVDASVFLHTVTDENSLQNSTYLDHPALNGNRDAWILVTHNWNPSGGSGEDVAAPLGVWYDDSLDRWAIFTQNETAMPVGAHFNVHVDSMLLFANGFEGLEACEWDTNDPYC